jgi:hypothetical protein
VLEAYRAGTDLGIALYVLADGAQELLAVRVGQAAQLEGAAGASLPHELEVVEVVRIYAETTRQYGGAALTVLTEAPRHPELRETMDALMPNLLEAAELIATHQERGRLVRGEPMQMLMMLLAPIMVQGLWSRTGASPVEPYDPQALVSAFLDGHRASGSPG